MKGRERRGQEDQEQIQNKISRLGQIVTLTNKCRAFANRLQDKYHHSEKAQA